MVIGVPLLASITTLWELPPWPTTQPTAHRQATKPMSATFAAPIVQIRPRDPSGIYRLVNSDYKLDDGDKVDYSKGKLVIKQLSPDSYLILEAKTIRSASTSGDADVYHVRPGRFGFDKVELWNNSRKWALLDGEQLAKRVIGANFQETTWWEKAADDYSEKYLDRAIRQAHDSYQMRIQRAADIKTDNQRDTAPKPVRTIKRASL
jgi:hypothetical protein